MEREFQSARMTKAACAWAMGLVFFSKKINVCNKYACASACACVCICLMCVGSAVCTESHRRQRPPTRPLPRNEEIHQTQPRQTLQSTPLHPVPELRRFVCKWKCPALTLVCTVGAASRCCSQRTMRQIKRLGRKLLFSLTAQPGVCATLDATDHNTSTWNGRCGRSICHRKEVLRAI